MSIDVTKLSPAAQEQIRRQTARRGRGGNKYNAVPTVVNSIRFDSRAEARRYEQLMLMLRAGTIRDLRLQPQYTLQEAYKTADGVAVRAIRYVADFSYRDQAGTLVVEDVKSRATKTRQYQIKRKLLLDRYGITVHEIA